MAATLCLERTLDAQRLLCETQCGGAEDLCVLQSRQSQLCFLCGAEARGEDSSPKSSSTYSRWPRLLCPAPTERVSDRGADSGSIYWPACEEIGGAHSPSAGRFLRTCTVSTEEPGMAGLLAREATCGAPPTASAELGLPGV